ncbi:MAG: hypothetical protein M1838_001999 [Thelocarpon superellum]|nr:MAG: hypothetical protein M1838_001999 [Thelocarpon superellum]
MPRHDDAALSDARSSVVDPSAYTAPFLSFITDNPTVFHAVSSFGQRLAAHGFTKLSERDSWAKQVRKGGRYFVERNGSCLIAFAVGKDYKPGNGAAIVAGHVDALTARLKPIPTLATKAGYAQLGVAPYAGALNSTWWDRDLGVGGRVLVQDAATGKIVTKLVKLDWPIARIPTLAPHFGTAARGPFNLETQMVPIIGLDHVDARQGPAAAPPTFLGREGTFAATQPARLVKAIAKDIGVEDYGKIMNWDLELFDIQPAQLGGLDKEFIFAGRIDDKLCSWAAVEALLASTSNSASTSEHDGIIKVVGLYDDEEIGSLLRQGAHSNLLGSVLARVCEAFPSDGVPADTFSQTLANSFLVSSDVTHAVNPNFLGSYLENHSPRLNTGICISYDSNGHVTTDAVSAALLQRVASKCDATLQLFQIRNDSRSGGTIGPMMSAQTGIRAIDAGCPQLSMHSIRATTGSLDPGLGVQLFKGFLDWYEVVDEEFR